MTCPGDPGYVTAWLFWNSQGAILTSSRPPIVDTDRGEHPVDNPAIARLLSETADLMEIDGADSFRIRSYRRAAEAVEQTTVDLMAVAADTERLLEIPGIGKSMAANIQSIAATGSLPQRDRAGGEVRHRHS